MNKIAAAGKIFGSLGGAIDAVYGTAGRAVRHPAAIGAFAAVMGIAKVGKFMTEVPYRPLASRFPGINPGTSGQFGFRAPVEGAGIAGLKFDFTRRK